MNSFFFSIKKLFTGSYNGGLLGVVVVMFCAYSFLIGSTVVSINQRKDLSQSISDEQSQVSQLEIQYFNVAQGIDMTKATQLGFVDAQDATFAYTNPGAQDAVAMR